MTDPRHPPTEPTGPPQRPAEGSAGRETYNVISDTVIGVNVRWKDNLFQAIAVGVFLVIGVVLGLVFFTDKMLGAGVGAIGGLLVGVLASGVAIMIFRGVRHLRGRHD